MFNRTQHVQDARERGIRNTAEPQGTAGMRRVSPYRTMV